MTTTEKPENFDPSILVAGIIVEVGDEILLLKRAPYKKIGANKWALCAGKIEEGEDAQETAVREVFEELGIVISVNDLEKVETYYHSPESDPSHRITWYVFSLSLNTKPHLVLNEEHTEYVWVHIQNVFSYDLIDGEAFCIENYLNKKVV